MTLETDLKAIFDPNKFYRHCCFCGDIVEKTKQKWGKVIYSNGKGGLPKEYNQYNISSTFCLPCFESYKINEGLK